MKKFIICLLQFLYFLTSMLVSSSVLYLVSLSQKLCSDVEEFHCVPDIQYLKVMQQQAQLSTL